MIDVRTNSVIFVNLLWIECNNDFDDRIILVRNSLIATNDPFGAFKKKKAATRIATMMMVDNRDGDRAGYRKRQRNPGLMFAVTVFSRFRWLLLIILVTLLPQTTSALVNNNCQNSLCRSVSTRNSRGVGGSILRDHGLLLPSISLVPVDPKVFV